MDTMKEMKELVAIQARLKVPKGQQNSYAGFKYRSAADILAAVKPLLAEQSVAIVLRDTIEVIGERYFLKAEVTLYREDGTQVAGSSAYAQLDEHKGMSQEQATGAASSYARKYALCGLLAIDDSAYDPDSLEPDDKVKRTRDYLAKNERALQYYFGKYPHCGSLEHFSEAELLTIYNELIKAKKL